MAGLVPLSLLAWILLVLVLFPRWPRVPAVIAAFVVGLLFLPVVQFAPGNVLDKPEPLVLPGLQFTKNNVIGYAVLLAVLLYDRERLLAFRPRWFDLPMLVWCLCPLASSLTNAPPPDRSWDFKDGVSQSLQQFWLWGIPYLMGRIYLVDLAGCRALALAVVLGGFAYVPFCLYEIRMSPQLHHMVYGYWQHEFIQTVRFGGYRPMVFMQHGLAVGMWMSAATLLGIWLWWTGAATRLKRGPGKGAIPMIWLLVLLVPTTVLAKSTGALALGMVGLGVLAATRWLKARIIMVGLLAVAPLYIAGRTSGVLTGDWVVPWVATYINKDRADSLAFRLENENLLVEKALEHPLFGWGGWGRARVHDDAGKDISVTDGLWIITLGDRGLVGLTALYLAMLLPVVRFLWVYPPRVWGQPACAPAAGLAVVVVLYMIDNLLNNMFNHVFVLAAGGLASMTAAGVRPRGAAVAPPAGAATTVAAPGQLDGPVKSAAVAPPAGAETTARRAPVGATRTAPRPGVLSRTRPPSG